MRIRELRTRAGRGGGRTGRRLRAVGAAGLAGLAVAGCASPTVPAVSFYAAGETARTGPAQHCDVLIEECSVDPEAVAELRVPPGYPLQVSVPGEVGDAPWQVTFRYREDGEEVEARSPVFPPGERQAYTLRLPDDAAQLETVEIQEFSAVLVEDPEGGVGFITRGTWVLSVDDR
ncbi:MULTISPECIES: DUF2771 family protein [Actinoalloteichus]|uniref:DUF2771 family protein n=1 Tax=Actinoalloteichus TaxID=65496 RepID=UPI001FE2062F|nr:DUF2771 family protein [Actinoalloteichus caeruleus]